MASKCSKSNDEAHLRAMIAMPDRMQKPEAMKSWLEKKKKFDAFS